MGIAYHIGANEGMDVVKDKINSLLYNKDDYLIENALRLQELIEFEELNSRNLSTYVGLGIYFGYGHLKLRHEEWHSLGPWILLYDIDIWSYIVGSAIFIFFILKGFICGRKRKY